jgi:thiol-disulfide isomerase/thioredoxin
MLRALVIALCLSLTALAQSSPEADALKQGQDLLQQKKYKEFLKLMKDTTKHYPGCSSCYLDLASFYSRVDDLPSAAEAADRAIKAASTETEQRDARIFRCQLLVGSQSKKELATAEEDCREAVRLDPKNADAHLNLGLVLLRESKDNDGLAEVQAYADGWPQAPYVKYAKRVLANPKISRESVAPDFAVTCEDGKHITSDELAGKVVVIDFWATWCPACRAALPDMKDLVRKYPSDRLVIISSSADSDESAWRNYVIGKEMTWPQVLDKNGSLSSSFDVHAFPTYIVIDGDGIIRKRIVGTDPQKSIAYQLKAELKSILEK